MTDPKQLRALVALAIVVSLGLYPAALNGQDKTPPKIPTLPAFLRDDDDADEDDYHYDEEDERTTPRRDARNAESTSRDARVKDVMRANNLDYLTLEREFRRVAPELAKFLPTFAEFSKRLPPRWSSLGLSTRQTEEIYRVEEEYHREIAQLQARVKALTEERNEKLLEILTEKQKSKLERILKDAVDVKLGKKKKDGANAESDRP